MSARRFPVVVAFAVAVLLAFTGCAPKFVPDPLLLTAEEVGGGKIVPLDARSGNVATPCGPDDPANYDSPPALWLSDRDNDVVYRENLVRYDQEDRSIVIGIMSSGRERNPSLLMRKDLESPHCGPDVGRTDPRFEDWVVSEIEGYPDNSFAFQSVMWRVGFDGLPLPAAPVVREGVGVYSTARVYTVVGDKTVMIRINSHDPEPPSADELRVLWEKQIAKIEAAEAENAAVTDAPSG